MCLYIFNQSDQFWVTEFFSWVTNSLKNVQPIMHLYLCLQLYKVNAKDGISFSGSGKGAGREMQEE